VTVPVVRCEALDKRFGDVVALDRLDVEVPAGQVVGFLGPNGAGKSTTIRILLDLSRPDGGRVEVLGQNPRTGGPALAQTLHSWARLRGGGVDAAVLDGLCERLSLDPGRETRGLSSGNRRKVGLVGAFMARPELLILDEPTGGLDPLIQAEFAAMVEEASADGATVFLSSHVLSEVQRVATHVVVIRRGRAVASGAVDEFRQNARQPFTAWLATDPPEPEFRSLPGLTDLVVRGREVSGVIEGAPAALLALLGRLQVEHLHWPEPDLEDAFLRFYEDDDDVAVESAP
jgi:ABC-2 type transport system ATP-binding protein